MTQLKTKIADKSALVGIVGLGYIWLPLVRTLIDAGYQILGFDSDLAKVEQLLAVQSYIGHLPATASVYAASTRGGHQPGARHRDRTDLCGSSTGGDVQESLADITTDRAVLGYEPIVGFNEGLQRSIGYYRSLIR